LAQLAQQYNVPSASTPWPTTLQPQCAQAGASAWMAHSKESKVWVSPSIVTLKTLSYSLPHTSHFSMGPLSCTEVVRDRLTGFRGGLPGRFRHRGVRGFVRPGHRLRRFRLGRPVQL